MSLAKVTFIKSVKVRRYGLCGCVAACYIKSMVVCVCVCVLCAVQSFTLHSTQHSTVFLDFSTARSASNDLVLVARLRISQSA
jgi:hypothetical protein